MPNPLGIVGKLKEAKTEKNYTNQDIADLTGVPKGTVDRVFAGRNTNFKYETLQPIIELLLTSDTNEVENQHDIISNDDQRPSEYKILVQEIEYLKSESNKKDALIADFQKTNRTYRIALFVLIAFICILFGVDILVGSVGWFRY